MQEVWRSSDTENTKEQSTKLLSLACRGAIAEEGEENRSSEHLESRRESGKGDFRVRFKLYKVKLVVLP